MSCHESKAEGESRTESTSLSIVEPIVAFGKIVGSMKTFEELKQSILTDEDWQTIGDKTYIKRSGFRKIALAFGLSDEILERVGVDRSDGSFVWRIRVRIYLWAKNERSSEGIGACDSRERGFSKIEHDVYATAHTRAKSRVISYLIAGGAVSAEEMEAGEGQVKQEQQKQEAQGPKPEVASPKPGKPFTTSLRDLFPSVALPDVGYAELKEGLKGTAFGKEEFFLTAEHTKRSNGTS